MRIVCIQVVVCLDPDVMHYVTCAQTDHTVEKRVNKLVCHAEALTHTQGISRLPEPHCVPI